MRRIEPLAASFGTGLLGGVLGAVLMLLLIAYPLEGQLGPLQVAFTVQGPPGPEGPMGPPGKVATPSPVFAESEVRQFYWKCQYGAYFTILYNKERDIVKAGQGAREAADAFADTTYRYLGDNRWLIGGDLIFEERDFRFLGFNGSPLKCGD